MAKPRVTKNSLRAGFLAQEEETIATRRALKSRNSKTLKAKRSKEPKKKIAPKKQKPLSKDQPTSSTLSKKIRKTITKKSSKVGSDENSKAKQNITTRSKNAKSQKSDATNKASKSETKKAIDSASLECGVCFELYVEPMTLKCTHTFCKYCIQQVKHTIGVDSCCPLCRGSLEGGTPAKKLALDLKTFVKTQPKTRRDSYATLAKKRKADCKRLPNTQGTTFPPGAGVMTITPRILYGTWENAQTGVIRGIHLYPVNDLPLSGIQLGLPVINIRAPTLLTG